MNNQQIALLESLLKRTIDGKVNWQRTAEDATFQAVVGGYVIQVAHKEDTPDLTIIDANGETIETVSTWRLSQGAIPDRSTDKAINTLAELFEMARRQAHGAEQAIDSILQELNS